MVEEIQELLSYSKMGFSGSFGDSQTLLVLQLPSGGRRKGDISLLRRQGQEWKRFSKSHIENLEPRKFKNLLPYLRGLISRARAWQEGRS